MEAILSQTLYHPCHRSFLPSERLKGLDSSRSLIFILADWEAVLRIVRLEVPKEGALLAGLVDDGDDGEVARRIPAPAESVVWNLVRGGVSTAALSPSRKLARDAWAELEE